MERFVGRIIDGCGGRGKAVVAGVAAAVEALAAVDGTSFLRLHDARGGEALVRVESSSTGKTFREDEDFCGHDSSESSESSSSSSSGVAAVKEKVRKAAIAAPRRGDSSRGTAGARRARWGTCGAGSIPKDFSADATQLKPASPSPYSGFWRHAPAERAERASTWPQRAVAVAVAAAGTRARSVA